MGRSETALFVLIGLLALWGLCVQLMVRRVVREERSLTEGDEDRLAEEIKMIERELVEEYREHEVEAWTADEEDSTSDQEAQQVDPNEMNSDGEFAVPELSREQQQVMLASRLLFPVTDDSWCELKLTRMVPAGSYQLAMSGVLGRWGAQASAGILLLQVRVRGQWQLLLGSPKRKREELEAPLEHNFSVAHGFDGVRIKASTWQTFNSGGRLSLLRLGTVLTSQPLPLQKRSRFLVFELERGHANAMLSVFNAIGLAMLLNVTAVIPSFHTFFDEAGNLRPPGDRSAIVPMDYFYDVDAFIATLAPMVHVVRRLPPALETFARDEEKQTLSFINPLLSNQELQRLADHFSSHNVLVLESASRALVWNTRPLVQLRMTLHAALRPAPRVAAYTAHVRAGIEAFATRKGVSSAFVGLQLPSGEDWIEYCRQQQIYSVTQGDDFRKCAMDSFDVTQALEERQVGELSRLLYVASGVLNISQVQHLHRQRFVVMTKSRFTLEMQPDIANAVDMQVCRESSLFVGNAYSAFSYLLRESKLVAGESERAIYYNMDVDATSGDLSNEETLRWDIVPMGTFAKS